MTKKLIFKKADGTIIENVNQYVVNWLKSNPYGSIILGCDSQVHGRRIKYSVVICMHRVDEMGIGHGAHVISADLWEKRVSKNQLDEIPSKLWKEAEYVLFTAQLVDGNDELFKKKIVIHLDFSPNEEHKSNMVYNAGIGMINGMGYKAIGKPDAYAACHTADHYCR